MHFELVVILKHRFKVVILNAVKDHCISPLLLLLFVLKSISSVQIGVKPSAFQHLLNKSSAQPRTTQNQTEQRT
jgi:hypothetical protein